MPKELFGEDHAFLPKSAILSFEELHRLASICVGIGVQKIRLTGGEPLLRRDLPTLVAMLARIPGLQDLALTTNGSALVQLARPLHAAGLNRLTVSLDALDDTIFRRMNDVDFPVHRVLTGLDAAVEAGFGSVKVNMVVKRGVNEDQILPMIDHFRRGPFVLRFIEFMDVGSTNGWRMDDVIPTSQIKDLIQTKYALSPLPANASGEVARRFKLDDGSLEIGFISSVTQPFCAQCTRARVSAEGQLYTCLFATSGHDVRALLRSGLSDDKIANALRHIWGSRDDRYSEIRSQHSQIQGRKVEMSHIGG